MTEPARKLSVVPPGARDVNDPTGPEDDVQLTLMDHLRELRKRIIYSAYALVIGFFVTYHFSDNLFNWLMKPVYDAVGSEGKIVQTHPTEAFFVIMNMAAYADVFLVSPFILYQFYKFVAPGLYRRERKLMVPFVLLGAVFFVGGALFARFIIMPFALDVLVKSYAPGGDSNVKLPVIFSVNETLTFVITILLAFGVIFELPLILSLLARMGVVSSAFLKKYRRHAIVANTVIAAIITPTGDAFNLMLMAVPLVVFYELGIIGAVFMERQRDVAKKNDEPQQKASETEVIIKKSDDKTPDGG